MGESVFRRNAVGNFKNTVRQRSSLLNGVQTITGRSIQDRNPVWVKVTGKCNACGQSGTMTVPRNQDTWDSTYKIPGFKPSPILESATLTYGGDWGLAQKLSVSIKCFDRGSFEEVQKYFLLPGNVITLRFGYATDRQWNSSSDSDNTVSGFKVATFAFSAGDDGTWIGNFTAVTSATAIKAVDMMQSLDSIGLRYSVAGKIDSSDSKDANSISELIASDAQRNGTESMDRVTKNNMGYVIAGFANYKPLDNENMRARMVLYTGDHLRRFGKVGDWGAWIGRATQRFRGTWDEAENALHEIYVTLGYVVDRIFNTQLKQASELATAGDPDFEKYKNLKVTFHPVYSKAKLPPGCESGDPLSVLILGGNAAKFKDASSGVMDFNQLRGFEGGASADDVIALKGTDVRLDKILLHRDTVTGALNAALAEKPGESESVDPKDTKDTVISMNDFFQELFSLIKECTGGALQLRLIYHPDDESRETILVVDQNYGGDAPIDCYVFNPIDGDGNTRSCNVASNGGSNEYRTSMFLANSKKGDVAAVLRDCESQLETGRTDVNNKALEQIKKLKDSPGLLYKDRFDGKQIAAFKSCMVDTYRYAKKVHNQYENINWPGMTIDITLNGAWGIIPGCAISSTQLANNWKMKNIYFMVTEVTHEFRDSDWSTTVKGIMSFYHKLNYINL